MCRFLVKWWLVTRDYVLAVALVTFLLSYQTAVYLSHAKLWHLYTVVTADESISAF